MLASTRNCTFAACLRWNCLSSSLRLAHVKMVAVGQRLVADSGANRLHGARLVVMLVIMMIMMTTLMALVLSIAVQLHTHTNALLSIYANTYAHMWFMHYYVNAETYLCVHVCVLVPALRHTLHFICKFFTFVLTIPLYRRRLMRQYNVVVS